MRKEKAAGPEVEEEDEIEDGRKDGEEAHGSEERREMKDGEPLKRGGEVKHERHKRARGGHIPEEKMPHHPKHHPRKRGGKVPGKKVESRPDRRARGGATSDMNPMTAAGRMSSPDYESKVPFDNGGGSRGGDTKGKNGRD